MPPSFQPASDRPFLFAGPCVIESGNQCIEIARFVKAAADRAGFDYVFKASFDKANRSSAASFRGPGLVDGLLVLKRVQDEVGVPVLTDIHEPEQAKAAGSVVDVLQVPAFLARQTDLLVAAGRYGKCVNIKKGQFMSPAEMALAAEKVRAGGPAKILLCERGTFFGYGRLVNDFTGLPIMKGLGHPVVYDATHSTQMPAGLGTSSGGNPQYSPMLARAAFACGADGLFLECHPDPAKAKSDAATVLPLDAVEPILRACRAIYDLRGTW